MRPLYPFFFSFIALMSSAESEQLAFAPSDGTRLKIEFERVLELSLRDSKTTIERDGKVEEVSAAEMPEVWLRETESVSYVDQYLMKNGYVLGIRRRFEAIGNVLDQTVTEPTGKTHESRKTGKSRLEGSEVLFRRQAETEDFSVRFADEFVDLAPELLSGLEARADFAGFLPEGRVVLGDKWRVAPAVFVGLTNLSGDLIVVQEGDKSRSNLEYSRQWDQNLKGSLEVLWKESRDVQGERHAVLGLHAVLTTEATIEGSVPREDAGTDEKTVDEFEFELAGELLWNLEQKHALSLGLRGAVSLTRTRLRSLSLKDQSVRVRAITSLGGEVQYLARVR